MKKCPNWPKVTFKTALRKAAEAKAIVQVKGTSTLVGSYKLGPKAGQEAAKAAPKAKKSSSKSRSRKGDPADLGPPAKPLDEILPNIFTRICEPKEASLGLIKKYIGEHHKKLEVDGKAFIK